MLSRFALGEGQHRFFAFLSNLRPLVGSQQFFDPFSGARPQISRRRPFTKDC